MLVGSPAQMNWAGWREKSAGSTDSVPFKVKSIFCWEIKFLPRNL